MKTLEIISLFNFAPLLQLAAGFYLVFIAIEYKKSFAALLSEHLYDFKNNLEVRFKSFVIEKCTLDAFGSREHYQKGKGKQALEQTMLKRERLDSLIITRKKELSTHIDNVCRCDVFRYLSIYMFAYCLVLLFLSGLITEHNLLFVAGYVAFYTIISCLVVLASIILSWYVRIIDRCKVLYIEISFVVVALSTLLPVIWRLTFDSYWMNIWIIISVLLPFITFLIYMLLFSIKAHTVKRECKQKEQDVKSLFDEIQSEISAMNGQVKQEEREKAFPEE